MRYEILVGDVMEKLGTSPILRLTPYFGIISEWETAGFKRVNTGVRGSLTGIGIGYTASTLPAIEALRKLLYLLVSPRTRFSFGCGSSTLLRGPWLKLERLNDGGRGATKIPCMGRLVRKTRIGKVGLLRYANNSMLRRSGSVFAGMFAIAIGSVYCAEGLGHSTITTSFPSGRRLCWLCSFPTYAGFASHVTRK